MVLASIGPFLTQRTHCARQGERSLQPFSPSQITTTVRPQGRRPFRDIGMTPPHRARNEVGISFEVFVGPDVNENGAPSRADQA